MQYPEVKTAFRTIQLAELPKPDSGTRRSAPKYQETTNSFEPLLDCVEAAALLRVHPKTLRTKARRGTIPAIQVGKLWRFRISALNEWLEKQAENR
jgi:excisionase family DNA binding protein